MQTKHTATPSSYVPAREPVREPAPRQAPTTIDAVSAKWRDNAGLGIGVFVVMVSVQWIAYLAAHMVGLHDTWYPTLTAVQMWTVFSFFTGCVGFGSLMMWRSALDEREKAGEFIFLRDRIAELEELLDDAEDAAADMEYRLGQAQVELRDQYTQMQALMASQRQFVPQAPSASAERIPIALYRDAALLAELSTTGMEYARDKVCVKYAWTTTRWYAARDVLVDAGIWRKDDKSTRVVAQNKATALAMLALYAGHNDSSENTPDDSGV
jgi:hypothetical protein